MLGKTINEIKVGDISSFTKTITETDIVMFGGISGDLNPAHFNEEFAKNSMFKTRIAHGLLSSSFFSTVLGMQLPGPGTIYLSQELKFKKPVYPGDTITATAKVINIIESKNRAILETIATNQKDEVVISGQATVMPPRTKKEE